MKLVVALVAGMVAVAAAASQHAAPSQPDPSGPRTAASGPSRASAAPLTVSDLGNWMDPFMRDTLSKGRIAGGQVVVVKDGRTLFQRGYGYADLAAKRPMDPTRSQMRIGSTSKLFTWTAVMQLVEAGKIDLNADVNRYLDFRITPPGNRPVTMADLMTHRGGFEEGLKDVLATDPKKLKTMERYLKENRRPFMFPPGEVPSYSNYGTTLAGYIVQRVSGEPFETYVQRHILTPLQMRHTTLAQPLPPPFARTAAKGYRTTEDAPSPFELVGTGPAGQVSTTAGDMANFMIAHLADGSFGNAAILRPETVRLMHSPSLMVRDGFDTLAHGFFHGRRNGRVLLSHGGDTVVFHSDLNLLPQEGVGIFVSFNSRGEDDAVYPARERLLELFLDRYYPVAASRTPPAIPSAAADAKAIAGRYESSRRVETGFISLFYLLQQDQVTANPDGTIAVSSISDKTFREIAPKLWREVGGARQLLATEVEGRRAIIDSNNPVQILQAAPLSRNGSVFQLVAGLSLSVLIVTGIAWPITAIVRRVRQRAPGVTGQAARVRRATRIAVIANLAYFAGWCMLLAPILRADVGFYNDSLDGFIRVLQIGALIPLAGAVLGAWNSLMAFRSGEGWFARIASLIVALALIGFLWAAWMAGFIGWSVNY
ncbi:serine hydrolase domain-containing protein [Sphingomonas turrisvirgatae]|uniref:Beta-lactamase-related domain-containing protein n=1 Tax=Sphingomonas turrisvirgatae TaxID=1888892 RepID=A0A1E3LZ86_9SPHN|nr:serine hydrolase domain-containing protein [Sphingomonas turrisvirgatae]ODP39033.1 hypothetical protein BFL28_12495 [Sphingomonas turrisvirgatae]